MRKPSPVFLAASVAIALAGSTALAQSKATGSTTPATPNTFNPNVVNGAIGGCRVVLSDVALRSPPTLYWESTGIG